MTDFKELKAKLDAKGKELQKLYDDYSNREYELSREYVIKAKNETVTNDELTEIEDEIEYLCEEMDITNEKIDLITETLRLIHAVEENIIDLETLQLI